MNPKEHEVQEGDLILPAWERILESFNTDEINLGTGLVVQHFPGQSLHIRSIEEPTFFIHPWKLAAFGGESVKVRVGTVAGVAPWLENGKRLGDEAVYGEVKLPSKIDKPVYLAVGVQEEVTDLDEEVTKDQFTLKIIEALPPGLGSGGIIAVKGWWWYPLIRLWVEGDGGRLRWHQIVHFNLGFGVVEPALKRAYFWGA